MKNVTIPTAKAGEKLAKPALVQTTFVNASVRSVKEEEGRQAEGEGRAQERCRRRRRGGGRGRAFALRPDLDGHADAGDGRPD